MSASNSVQAEAEVVRKPIKDGVSSNSNKIVVTIEDGKMVFKKPQESLDEIIFYNTDYFTRIGFPDAEVSVGIISPDGTMKGGRYKNTDDLTYPFRHFVFFLQPEETEDSNSNANTSLFSSVNNAFHYIRNNKPSVDVDVDTPEVNKLTEDKVSLNEPNKPGFFERLGQYNNAASNYLKSSMQNVNQPSYFKTSPTEITTVDNSGISPFANPEKSTIDDNIPSNYWIVRIPILKDDDPIPKGKYEKEEANYAQRLLQYNIEVSLGKTNVGKMYSIGNRNIKMCESVKNGVDKLKYEMSPLKGSLMDKLSKI